MARATPHRVALHSTERHSRIIASGGKYQEQGFAATRGNYARGQAGFRLNRAFAPAARNTRVSQKRRCQRLAYKQLLAYHSEFIIQHFRNSIEFFNEEKERAESFLNIILIFNVLSLILFVKNFCSLFVIDERDVDNF